MSGSGEQGVVGRAIGDGRNLFSAGQVHGVARWFLAPADVVLARENELAGVIAFVERGGMTFLSPVISQVGAVVCTNGSLEAPLAILARELEIPCVMAARLTEHIEDGDALVLDLRDPSIAGIHREPVDMRTPPSLARL